MNMMKKKALLWLVCAVIGNLFVFFTMQLSRGFSSSVKKRGTPIIPASDVPFWRMDEPPKAYWNREQWRLERSYNPILVNGSQKGSVTAAIRESWGAETSGNVTVRRVFLLGRPANPDLEPNLQHLLNLESKRYSDILQWDFRDSFFNLTLKELLFLKWVEQRCSDVRFIFKGDDDVLVNTDRTVALLNNITAPDKVQNLFLGDVIVNAGPHRDKKKRKFSPAV